MFPENVLVYVLHVDSPQYSERKRHILSTMKKHQIPFNWMLAGDIADINNNVLEELFDGDLFDKASSIASCCYKHYLVWEAFLASEYQYLLVFEDDVFLSDDFIEKFRVSLKELSLRSHENLTIYYGNAANLYTPSKLIQDSKTLYENTQCRAADSYLLTRESALKRCEYIQKNKFSLSVDLQTNVMDPILGIDILWFERPIVEQGSQSGCFKSSIQKNKYPQWMVKILWMLKKHRRVRR